MEKVVEIFVSPVPSTLTIHIEVSTYWAACCLEVKAIRRPSEDQAGLQLSSPELLTRRVWMSPSRLTRSISSDPP